MSALQIVDATPKRRNMVLASDISVKRVFRGRIHGGPIETYYRAASVVVSLTSGASFQIFANPADSTLCVYEYQPLNATLTVTEELS